MVVPDEITADEAREIAGVLNPRVEEFITRGNKSIKEAAHNGKRRTIVRDSDVSQAGYITPPGKLWTVASDYFTNKGFNVSFFYEERQFVDMGMLIEW